VDSKRLMPKQQQAKNWFLTYPQCSVKKEQAQANLWLPHPQKNQKKETITVQWTPETFLFVIIAEETHADGSPHLHLLLSFKSKFLVRDLNIFDFIVGKHGNYGTVRDLPATIKYARKDGNYLEIGKVPASLANSGAKTSKSTLVSEMLRSGKSLMEIDQLFPGYLLQNLKKVKEYQLWLAISQEAESKSGIKEILYHGNEQESQSIVDWLNMNLNCIRPMKSPQLYLKSPPNYCKTTLVMIIGKYIPVYKMPTLELFYDLYQEGIHLLGFLDEFVGQIPIHFMNDLLQGSEVTLRIKGGQSLKKANIPFIICSNYYPENCYSKEDQYTLSTFNARIKLMELTKPIDIDNIEIIPKPKETTEQEQEHTYQSTEPLDIGELEIESYPGSPATPPIDESQFTLSSPYDDYEPYDEQFIPILF